MTETIERRLVENIGSEQQRTVVSQNDVVSHISSLAQERTVVVLEGSPIYLFPQSDLYASQGWDHRGFTNGWELINALDQRLASDRVRHAVLIDDFNNVSEGDLDANVIDTRFHELSGVSPIRESVIFDTERPEDQVIFRFETDFTRDEDESFNVCSNLDAGFQREKILFSLDSGHVTADALEHILFVVAHPTEFRTQQSMMLTSLLGEMKHEPFNQIPKKQRREVLERIYRHVWFDGDGNIENVTHPLWNGQKFVHEEERL